MNLNLWRKRGTVLKILTPNELLTRLSLLLAKTKPEHNSNKLLYILD